MEYTYFKKNENGLKFCDYEEAEYVLLNINEFNGLKKAVRIVNDRALQQIDKSKADEYGFRLLRAGKSYNREAKGMMYLVTKETPYSIKMRLDEAWALIETTLRELYYWLDEFDLNDFAPSPEEYKSSSYIDNQRIGRLYDSDIPKIIKQWENKDDRSREFLLDNSKKGRAIKNLWSKRNDFIVGIAKVSANQAQGVYEVSYWCTKPI